MKILAISDVPSKALWDYGTREHLEGIDLILSCGDLPQKYLEYLTNFTAAPILYVHGNHDGSYRENEPGGCICVDDSVYVWKGLRIMGLGGSIRYNNREDSFQYTEREMRRRVRKLWRKAHHVGGIDLLLTHSPAAGLNDSTDHAHKGFACFNDLMDEYEPQWFVHGHVHLNYDAKLPRVCTRGKTTVINATERYVFEIPDCSVRLSSCTGFSIDSTSLSGMKCSSVSLTRAAGSCATSSAVLPSLRCRINRGRFCSASCLTVRAAMRAASRSIRFIGCTFQLGQFGFQLPNNAFRAALARH